MVGSGALIQSKSTGDSVAAHGGAGRSTISTSKKVPNERPGFIRTMTQSTFKIYQRPILQTPSRLKD